jgi:hypothetical protein
MTETLNIFDLKNGHLFENKIKSISILGELTPQLHKGNLSEILSVRDLHRKLIKNIHEFPPPEFVLMKNTFAQDLLVYLHEPFNEYCDEFMLQTVEAKFFILLKVFDKACSKMKDLRGRIKIFFESLYTELTDNSVDENTIFLKLVTFLAGKYVEMTLKTRLQDCSLAVYFNDAWKILSYCGVEERKIGIELVKRVYDHSEVLNCNKLIINKFKDMFCIKVLMKEYVSRAEILNFAIKNDIRFKDDLSRKFSESYGYNSAYEITGQEVDSANESDDHESLSLAYLYRKESVPTHIQVSECFNCGLRGHWANRCFKPKVTCVICGKDGHLAMYCKKVDDHNRNIFNNNCRNDNQHNCRSDNDHNWRSTSLKFENFPKIEKPIESNVTFKIAAVNQSEANSFKKPSPFKVETSLNFNDTVNFHQSDVSDNGNETEDVSKALISEQPVNKMTSRLVGVKPKSKFSHFHTQKYTKNAIELIDLVHTSRGHSTVVGTRKAKYSPKTKNFFETDDNQRIWLYREKDIDFI